MALAVNLMSIGGNFVEILLIGLYGMYSAYMSTLWTPILRILSEKKAAFFQFLTMAVPQCIVFVAPQHLGFFFAASTLLGLTGIALSKRYYISRAFC